MGASTLKSKPAIHFLDADTLDLGDISFGQLQEIGRYTTSTAKTLRQALKKAHHADVVISNKFFIGEEQMRQLPRLRLICVAATGTNNVDLEAARRRGIAVCNVAGYSTPSVVEQTILFLLALSHRLLEHHEAVRRKAWQRSPHFALLDFPFSELSGKTLGILGYGTIGRRVAKVAVSLDMRVRIGALPGQRYGSTPKRIPLDRLLRESDFVSLHCALSSKTQQLIGAKQLAKMKPTAFLLNLARGPIVDETAVARSLLKKQLAGYASDVLAAEPPPAKHPLWQETIRERVLLTPHIAWASREARQRLADEIAANIAAFLKGKKRNRVV